MSNENRPATTAKTYMFQNIRKLIVSSKILCLKTSCHLSLFKCIFTSMAPIVILSTLNYSGADSVLGYMHQVQMDFFARISNPAS